MPQMTRQACVPYSPKQMYDLVSDVARYPEFLPWCSHLEVLHADAISQKAKMILHKGPVRQTLITENTLIPHESIAIHMVEGPFKHYRGLWLFKPHQQGASIAYTMDFSCTNPWLDAIVGKAFEGMADQMVARFKERAEQVYGVAQR